MTRTALTLILAALASSSIARASEPPPSPCLGTPPYEGWIHATVVAKDPRTQICDVQPPAAGPAGDACIDPSGDECNGPGLLAIDGAARETTTRVCGITPGAHTITFCGIDCGAVDVAAGTTARIHLRSVEPALTVHVDRVLEGDPALRGQRLDGTLSQWTPGDDHGIFPGRRTIDELSIGQQVELWWPAGTPRAFTRLPGCHPDLQARGPAPGCTRCDAASSSPASLILLLPVLLLLRRSRA